MSWAAAEDSTRAVAMGRLVSTRKKAASGSFFLRCRRTKKTRSVSPLERALSRAISSSSIDRRRGTCFPARVSWFRSWVARWVRPSS